MPVTTNSERIAELTENVVRHDEILKSLGDIENRLESKFSQVDLHGERIERLRQELGIHAATLDNLNKEFRQLQHDVVRIQTRFEEHQKQTEKWDARRWTIIGLFIGALLSLVANLAVLLARRTP